MQSAKSHVRKTYINQRPFQMEDSALNFQAVRPIVQSPAHPSVVLVLYL